MTAKRGSQLKGRQIKVYGAWFCLTDTERIKPIQQLEEEEEEEEGEGEEEEGTGSEGEDGEEESSESEGMQIGSSKQQSQRRGIATDSSDEEVERNKKQKA